MYDGARFVLSVTEVSETARVMERGETETQTRTEIEAGVRQRVMQWGASATGPPNLLRGCQAKQQHWAPLGGQTLGLFLMATLGLSGKGRMARGKGLE